MQSGGARNREPLFHEDFGAAVPAEPRLADPLFQIKIRPDVGWHVRQPVFTALPPAGEADVVSPKRRAVHQLDHRIADALVRPAAAEHLCQGSLRAGCIAAAFYYMGQSAEAIPHAWHAFELYEAGNLPLRTARTHATRAESPRPIAPCSRMPRRCPARRAPRRPARRRRGRPRGSPRGRAARPQGYRGRAWYSPVRSG